MLEIHKPVEKLQFSPVHWLERAWSEKDNEKWRVSIPQEFAMFRDDEPGNSSTLTLPEFISSIEDIDIYRTNWGWVQFTKANGRDYKVEASIIGPGLKDNGNRTYHPDRPNFIYHHWASATKPQRHARILRQLIPKLNDYNVISITADRHLPNYDKRPGNPMTWAIPSMEALQGVLASSILLTENIARNSDNETTFMGISMGGIVGLWSSIMPESPIKKRFILMAHPEYRQIFFNHDFRGQTNQYEKRLDFKDYQENDLEKLQISDDTKRLNLGTFVFYGIKDTIINFATVEKASNMLGVPSDNLYPYLRDHKEMGAEFFSITKEVNKLLS